MELLDPYFYSDDNADGDLAGGETFGAMSLGQTVVEGGATDIASPKAVLARRFINEIRDKLETLEKLLAGASELDAQDVERLLLHTPKPRTDQGQVVEGVFDGEHMMGSDGKQYAIPANYASKSKLVEGDILKLTITREGTFLYKQIGPIERQRVIGKLAQDELTGDYVVIADGKKWSILLASVTYFRAEPGDNMVILIPKNAPSRWAAVENAIKKDEILEKE